MKERLTSQVDILQHTQRLRTHRLLLLPLALLPLLTSSKVFLALNQRQHFLRLGLDVLPPPVRPGLPKDDDRVFGPGVPDYLLDEQLPRVL
jgi:hypothetical protein